LSISAEGQKNTDLNKSVAKISAPAQWHVHLNIKRKVASLDQPQNTQPTDRPICWSPKKLAD